MIKKLTKILLIVTLILCCNVVANARVKDNDWSKVIHAISYVESNWNPKAVSSCGRWVGYLQISKGMVQECNRILGKNKFTYQDRYDKNKSIEMFYIFQNKYNPNGDIELAIRMWNGGTGFSYRGTNRYYNAVMKKYNELI